MKKIYKKNWLFNPKLVATAVALFFMSGMASAQMTGVYTLDSTSASSLTTKNFQSFNDLADSLELVGVSGAVTVNVTAAPSGSYNEQVTFNAIFGTSSTNTVTINGNGAKIETSLSYVINVNGADYLTFDNLVVDNTGSNSTTRCFWVHNSSNYLTISNSELIASGYSAGSGSGSGYVVFSPSSSSSTSSGTNGSNFTISDNTMWGGSSTATTGVYTGISYYRSSSSTVNGTITGNFIDNARTYGMRFRYAYGLKINDNIVEGKNNTTNWYGIYMYYNRSSFNEMKDNIFRNIEASSTVYGMYVYYTHAQGNVMDCTGNRVTSLSTTGTMYGMRLYYNDDTNWDGFEIDNVSTTAQYRTCYTLYAYSNDRSSFNDGHVHDCSGDYMYNVYLGYQDNTSFDNNVIEDCDGNYYYAYGFRFFGGSNSTANGNIVRRINHKGDFGYLYPIYFGYGNNNELNNNLLYDNTWNGYYHYNIYCYWYGNFQGNMVANNTVRFSDNTANYQLTNTSGIYWYHRNSSEPAGSIMNNNIYIDDNNTTYFSIGIWSPEGDPVVNNNNIYTTNTATTAFGAWGTTGYTTLAGWQNASGADRDMNYDPEFVNLAGEDYTPASLAMANRGEGGIVSDDINSSSRPSGCVDVGAIEYYTDFSASNFTLSGADRCGNSSDEITFDLTNGYGEDLPSLDVFYTLNGAQVDEVSDTIGANSTESYTFASMPVYNEPGLNTVTVGIWCDDNDANNVLTQTFNVVASPSGGDLAEGGTFEGYFNSGSMMDPDITVPNTTSVYDIVSPSKYTAGSYGTDWDITDNSMTSGGMATTGLGITVDGTAGTVTVDPDPSLVDSMIYVSFVINDLNTGCDSTVGRWMYVPFTPEVSFTMGDVCLGTIATMKNTSTMGGNDFMIYKWNYNDPNSDEDTSEIKNGFWDYSTYGNFDVTLEVRNQSYPKFAYSVTQTITVTPTPVADFSIINACEGQDIQFNDETTSPLSDPITYVWNFGDGSANSTMQNPTHQYATPAAEGYQVTLTSTQNGCKESITKTAYQFATPVADFSTAGACNLEEIEFTNGTTISIGKTGYTWDFGDGGISTLANPSHVYSSPGTHTVTMTAYSEFGCEDEVTIDVDLLESPESVFSYDATCNLTPVNFTMTGTYPGTEAENDFAWDFNGEAAGSGRTANHLFPEVGTKTVTLTVTSLNGCSSTTTEELDVVLQAVADFDVADICEGDEAVFTNKSSVAAGDLTYTWFFGEADDQGVSTSDYVSPRHRYTVQNSTRIISVRLVAEVEGGCNAEFSKDITVNAAPDASFTADVQGRTVVFNANDDGNAIYSWRFGNGSSDDVSDPVYTYDNVDNGTFTVCLSTKNDLCWSEECNDVTVDLVGVEELTQDDAMINVYPNPSTGKFNLEVENAGDDVTIAVSDILGNSLDITVTDNLNGNYMVDLSNVADGVYFVQVKNGDYFATKRITVSK